MGSFVKAGRASVVIYQEYVMEWCSRSLSGELGASSGIDLGGRNELVHQKPVITVGTLNPLSFPIVIISPIVRYYNQLPLQRKTG